MLPVNYFQHDIKWGGMDYSAPGEKTTIAKAGCGPTCAAMVIASLKDPSVTPAVTAEWSKAHGYKACKQGTYYSYFVPQLAEYGIKAEQVNTANIYKKANKTAEKAHNRALEAVYNGKWVIACMGPGNWTGSGHFVLWYRVNGIGEVMIHDPASAKPNRIRAKLKTFQNEVKFYWIIDVPQEDEVVEKRKITLFGKQYTTDGIFKENKNYISPKVLADAGLDLTSQGAEPIVSMPTIKLEINGVRKAITGFESNGTTYCGIRQLAELLGHEVDWADGTVIIK